VAVSIVDERVDFLTVVLTDPIAASAVRAAFVDVVAGVKHEVEMLVSDPSKRGEVSALVVIAAADGKPQAIDRGAGRRRGSGPPGLTDLVAGSKPVPVIASRLEPADLDVDTVAQFRPRERRAFLRDRLKARVARNLPVDLDVRRRHAAALERLRRQSRPQDDAVGEGSAPSVHPG